MPVAPFAAERSTEQNVSVPRSRICGYVERFTADERGVTSVIWAVTFTSFFVAAAMAIDYGLAVTEQHREQHAIDGATLAALKHAGAEEQEAVMGATANAFYNTNKTSWGGSTVKAAVYDAAKAEMSANAGTVLKTKMLKLKGVDRKSFDISARSKASLGTAPAEVVLVLDNSAAMDTGSGALNGTLMQDLKDAATRITNILFAGAEESEGIRIGLVPFAGSVNVGAIHKDAGWISQDPAAPAYHGSNMVPAISRFEALARMGEQWKGCVEVRPAPHDVSDTLPNANTPESLFVPLFAPDEPDEANAANDYYPNSYIPDTGGTCPPQKTECVKTNASGKCTQSKTVALAAKEAQERSCKYEGASPDRSLVTSAQGEVSLRKGPQIQCDSTPITPLTGRKQDVLDAIDAMAAAGGSNISEGVMWGWRVLSPDAPFTEAQNSPEGAKKVMIVLARGDNFLEGERNINDSWYSAWGFGANNRLNPSSHTTTALTNSMNETTRAACRNVADADVAVYTIRLGSTNAHTRALMKYCATKPSMAYEASDGDELNAILDAIGRQLRPARLAG